MRFIHWIDENEVDGCSNKEKADSSCQNSTGSNWIAVPYMELANRIEVWFANQAPEEGVDDAIHKILYDRGEGVGDNNSDGKFDDVAAHDEFLETLNHGESISFFWVDGPRALLQRGRDGHAPWG